ncbi:MAG: C39 family peptidase [Acidobacteria bacterium]|nr:C39 family peptidase [Acidobacteriota bacterium]
MQRQEKSEWCWAAVSVSVDRFFRPNSRHTQCDIAGAALGRSCCDGARPAPSDSCNTPHALHPVLGRFHLLAADPIVKPLTFNQVRTEIDAGRPVCVLIKWLDNNGQVTDRGHFIALDGYRVTPAQKMFVSITDPMYGSSETSFDQFVDRKGGYRDGRGVWFASFLVANKAAF